MIASSPTDIQPVLDVVAERAAQICDASDAQIFRVNDGVLRLVASYGSVPARESAPIMRGSVLGRSVVDREPIHVHDLAAVTDTEFPESKAFQQRFGDRTALAMPLLREGIPIGAILIRRFEVRPFSEKQIAILKTFADQAVIAIENVRLFKELEDRNQQLTETLDSRPLPARCCRLSAVHPRLLIPSLKRYWRTSPDCADPTSRILRSMMARRWRLSLSMAPRRNLPNFSKAGGVPVVRLRLDWRRWSVGLFMCPIC